MLLFVVGGLTILNNLEFGVAALGASVAAIAWASTGASRPPRRLRLALVAGAGLATALALVCLLTLVRAGSLPQLDRLTDFTRLFAVAGFAMMPIPGLLGLHLVIYLTHVAAIVVGTVRAVDRERDRLLTGMLVVGRRLRARRRGPTTSGRSHPTPLKFLFSAWALTLALLTIVVVRDLARRRQPSIAAALVLLRVRRRRLLARPGADAVGRGAPLRQRRTCRPTNRTTARVPRTPDEPGLAPLRRDDRRRPAPLRLRARRAGRDPAAHRTSRRRRLRGAQRLAYTGMESTPTVERVEAALDALARAGGNTLILPNPVDGGHLPACSSDVASVSLTHHGLDRYDPRIPHSDAVMPPWPYNYVIKWVDTRHLHPRALE